MNKYFPWFVSLLLALGLVYQIYEFNKLKNSLSESNQIIADKLNSFDESLGRANIRMDQTGELLEAMQHELPKDILAEVNSSMVEISTIAKAIVEHRSSGGGPIIQRGKVPSGKAQPSGAGDSIASGDKRNSTPVVTPRTEISSGEDWDFSDWRLTAKVRDGYFRYTLNQKFDVLFVKGSRDKATPTYLRVWELGSDGKRLEPALIVRDFTVTRRRDSPNQFDAFNPKLEVSLSSAVTLDSGEYSPSAEVSLSFMSYGETKDDTTWRFARVGVSINDSIGISLSPGSFNLGKELPLVSNVWISPTYIYNDGHSVGVSLGGVL